MSKLVKNLIGETYKNRLVGVTEALVVDVIGLDSGKTSNLRKRLREKKIYLLVVKNSLAHRATEGTALATAFTGGEGSSAIVWGGEDIVSLAKEIVKISQEKDYEKLKTHGGVLDGARLTAEEVKAVSKWPSRAEQLSLLVGQILGPGATLAAQLLGPGGTLAGQVKTKSEGADDAAPEAAAPEASAAAPEAAPPTAG